MFLFLLICSHFNCTPPPPQEVDFTSIDFNNQLTVILKQQKKTLIIKNGQSAAIEASPFSFILVSKEIYKYLVNISKSPETFKMLIKGEPFSRIACMSDGSGIVEEYFNANKMVFVRKESSNYWFYETAQKTRFNSYQLQGKHHIQTRTIEQFDLPGSKQTTPVAQLKNDTFYVSIMVKRYDSLTESRTEHMRFGFKLCFGGEFSVAGQPIDKITIREQPQSPKEEPEEEVKEIPETKNTDIVTIRIPALPADNECFKLFGKDSTNTIMYSQLLCSDALVSDGQGAFECTFTEIAPKLLYFLEVVFPNGRSYYMFKAKTFKQLVGKK